MAILFDGVDDFIPFGHDSSLDPGTGDFTYLVWFNSSTSANQHYALRCGDAANIWTAIQVRQTTGIVRATFDDNGSVGNVNAEGSTDVTDGEWHLIGISADRDGNLYPIVDGVREGAGTSISAGADNLVYSANCHMGKATNSEFVNGSMTELTMWNTLLTDAELLALYTARIKGSCRNIQPSSVVCCIPMDDGEHGTSADGEGFRDISGNGNTGTGDDGANNTGLTWEAEAFLSYPGGAIVPEITAAGSSASSSISTSPSSSASASSSVSDSASDSASSSVSSSASASSSISDSISSSISSSPSSSASASSSISDSPSSSASASSSPSDSASASSSVSDSISSSVSSSLSDSSSSSPSSSTSASSSVSGSASDSVSSSPSSSASASSSVSDSVSSSISSSVSSSASTSQSVSTSISSSPSSSASSSPSVEPDADEQTIFVQNGNVFTAIAENKSIKSLVPGTGATALGKAEDAAHTSGDTGVMALGVRRDTQSSMGGTDGDYVPLQFTTLGSARMVATDVVPGTSATNLGKAEDAAHTTGDTGVMALSVRQDTPAALAGTTGDYQPPTTDDKSRLWTAPSDYGLEVVKGNISGSTTVNKFGAAHDFDTGDGEVLVWDASDDSITYGSNEASKYARDTWSASTTADIGIMSSDAAGTQNIEVQGTDGNGDLLVQTFALNGTTDVDLSATGSDYKRVFRMKNTNSTSLAGHVWLRTNGSSQTAGEPDDAATIRGMIHQENNQTEMAVYHVPTAKTVYMKRFYAKTSGGSRTTNYIIRLFARASGGVYQLKYKSSINDDSPEEHSYELPLKFTAGTDIAVTAETTETAITGSQVIAGFDLILVDD